METIPDVITIPKEEAVFWLDAEGRWHNKHGPFEHPKVRAHFHASIRKDENGYYVGQQRDAVYEKVYFRYADTALFVFGVEIGAKEITLKLNTGLRDRLRPEDLFTRDDNLYTQTAQGLAKFNQQSLMVVAKLLDEQNGTLCIKVGEDRFKIRICANSSERKRE